MGVLIGLNRILGRLTGFWVVSLVFGWFGWVLAGLAGFLFWNQRFIIPFPLLPSVGVC